MEPLNVNGGLIQPAPGYLEAARELTAKAGTVLIFDEVITGYRLALGGAQERFGVTPDLTILGKALAAGFPVSAVCGSARRARGGGVGARRPRRDVQPEPGLRGGGRCRNQRTSSASARPCTRSSRRRRRRSRR